MPQPTSFTLQAHLPPHHPPISSRPHLTALRLASLDGLQLGRGAGAQVRPAREETPHPRLHCHGAPPQEHLAAGLEPQHYGAHSLRIGGASAALAAGVPPALIRMMGRWSSDVYEIYCRASDEAVLRFGVAIGGADFADLESEYHNQEF